MSLCSGAAGSQGVPAGAPGGDTSDRVRAARAALSRGRLDSAELLLTPALDSANLPSVTQRVEAWLLLGVVRYYRGDDAGIAAAFRAALALDPALQAPGLGAYDQSLMRMLEELRAAGAGVGAGAADSPRVVPVANVEAVRCVPSCPKGVTPPRVQSMPGLEFNEATFDPSSPPRNGRMVVRFVVTAEGRVDSASIVIVVNTLPFETFYIEFKQAYLRALEGARFAPARRGDDPVAAVVERVVQFRPGRRTVDP